MPWKFSAMAGHKISGLWDAKIRVSNELSVKATNLGLRVFFCLDKRTRLRLYNRHIPAGWRCSLTTHQLGCGIHFLHKPYPHHFSYFLNDSSPHSSLAQAFCGFIRYLLSCGATTAATQDTMPDANLLAITFSVTEFTSNVKDITQSIANIYGNKEKRPRALQQQLDELAQLLKTIQAIKQDCTLQTAAIRFHLVVINMISHDLNDRLDRTVARNSHKKIKRFWRAWTGTLEEKQLLKIFARLLKESDALTISIMGSRTTSSSRTYRDELEQLATAKLKPKIYSNYVSPAASFMELAQETFPITANETKAAHIVIEPATEQFNTIDHNVHSPKSKTSSKPKSRPGAKHHSSGFKSGLCSLAKDNSPADITPFGANALKPADHLGKYPPKTPPPQTFHSSTQDANPKYQQSQTPTRSFHPRPPDPQFPSLRPSPQSQAISTPRESPHQPTASFI